MQAGNRRRRSSFGDFLIPAIARVAPDSISVQGWLSYLQNPNRNTQLAALRALNIDSPIRSGAFGWTFNFFDRGIMGDLPFLIPFLTDQDPKAAKYATELIVTILTVKGVGFNFPGLDASIHAGLIRQLLASLKSPQVDLELKAMRLRFLGLLAKQNDCYKRILQEEAISLRLTPDLISLLETEDRYDIPYYVADALAAIFSFAQNSDISCELYEARAIPKLVALAQSLPPKEKLFIVAQLFYRVLLKDSVCQNQFIQSGGIALTQRLLCGSPIFVKFALAIIAQLSLHNVVAQNAIREAGLIPQIVDMFMTLYKQSAIEALLILAENNEANKIAMCHARVIERISTTFPSDKELLLLGKLAENNPFNQRKISELVGFRVIVRALNSSPYAAMYAIQALAYQNSQNQEGFRCAGVIPIIVQNLSGYIPKELQRAKDKGFSLEQRENLRQTLLANLHDRPDRRDEQFDQQAYQTLLSLCESNERNIQTAIEAMRELEDIFGPELKTKFLQDLTWSNRQPLVLRRANEAIQSHEKSLREDYIALNNIEGLKQFVSGNRASQAFLIAANRVLADTNLSNEVRSILSSILGNQQAAAANTATAFNASQTCGNPAAGSGVVMIR